MLSVNVFSHLLQERNMSAFQINDTFGFQSGVKVKVIEEVSEK